MPPKLQHYRTATADKRPDPAAMADGQMAQNQAPATPGAFIKLADGTVSKIGPAHVGPTAPNSAPAGSAGNSLGETWHDTSVVPPVMRIWDGAAWAVHTGPQGPQGPAGADGAASTVPGPEGPQGPPGADSVVPGPQGPPGADSVVPGPPGPTAVSADAGNTSTLGTDGLIYTPAGASVDTGDTAPVSPVDGDLWFRTDRAELFIWYNDGDSGQWVEVTTGNDGPQGPAGPPGPTAVSADAGNISTLGTDGLIYTNAKSQVAIYTFNYSVQGPVLNDIAASPDVSVAGWVDVPAGFTDFYCVSTFSTNVQYDTVGQPTLHPFNFLFVESGAGPTVTANPDAYTSCMWSGILNNYGNGIPLTTAYSKAGLDPAIAHSVTVGAAKLPGGGAIRIYDLQLSVLAWNRSLA